MKEIIIGVSILFSGFILLGQDFSTYDPGRIGINVDQLKTYLTIEGETQGGPDDKRSFVILNNLSDATSSVVNIQMASGTNSGLTLLSHHSPTYDFPTYDNQLSDFGQLYSRGNGLVLRTGSAENPNGVIKFMTGILPNGLSLERMRLSREGFLGVGTNDPKSKIEVADGDIFVSSISRGIILLNAENECFRIGVDVDGQLTSTPVTCPN